MKKSDFLVGLIFIIFCSTFMWMSYLNSQKIKVKVSNLNNGKSWAKQFQFNCLTEIKKREKLNLKGKKVLLIGDSMFEGLTGPLNDYFMKNDMTSNTVVWYGSTTKCWCRRDTLDIIMEKYKPDFVFFSCGTNEILLSFPRLREPYIKKIRDYLSKYKFIWIGPPNWTTDNTMNNLIDSTLGFKNFYPSQYLTFERKRDGIHPSNSSSKMWADSIISFMNKTESDEIFLTKPDTFTFKIVNYNIIPISLVNIN